MLQNGIIVAGKILTKNEEWEELVQRFCDCKENIQECFWKMAEIVYLVSNKFGGTRDKDRRMALKEFSSDVGISVSYAYELSRMYDVFVQKVEDKNLIKVHNLNPSHYRVALRSKDPSGWIERASNEGMSVRDLSDAIRKEEGKSMRVNEWAFYSGLADDIFKNLLLDYKGKNVDVKVKVN